MPPTLLAATMGLQYATLCVAGIVLIPAIIVRAAGGSDEYLGWAVFGAIFVSGTTTILQARRLWRIGAGYILLMRTYGAFIAVSIAALSAGGPVLLAKLVIVSSLFQSRALATPAASLCVLGEASAVPRHRRPHGHGEQRQQGAERAGGYGWDLREGGCLLVG